MKITKKIHIEGDFIDSFIYSGSLFLVDTQLKLTTYSWNDLLNASNCTPELNKTLHNCFSDIRTENIEALEDTYTVYHDVLNTHCTDELFLDSWPTDLDIYKNNFLISSNEGIQTFKCNREQNGQNVKIDFDKNIKKMWNEKVFELAVGSLDRLIISCGVMGAFELFTNSYSEYRLTKDKHISDKEWIGCEWDMNTGIAILKNQLKQELLKFETLNQDHLSKLSNQLERNQYFKTIKEEEPQEYELPTSNQSYINSWVFDDKIYLFGEDLKLYEYSENSIHPVTQVDTNQKSIGTIIDSAKTHFGVVFEDLDNLYLFDSNIHILSNDVTNWRTYPKSINYQNHIHLIEDDYMTVQIFE